VPPVIRRILLENVVMLICLCVICDALHITCYLLRVTFIIFRTAFVHIIGDILHSDRFC
jgi:hypothetical protein